MEDSMLDQLHRATQGGVPRRTALAALASAAFVDVRAAAPVATGFSAGGRVGRIVDGHWTPGRDEAGRVARASVLALPKDRWFSVAGTELATLVAGLAKAGWDLKDKDWSGGKDIRRTFSAWVGCARDGMRIYYPRGGGHADSSLNGTWVFDVATMAWGIQDMPSNPDHSASRWDRSYAPPQNKATFTKYTEALPGDDGLYRDVLPDGRPTSAHTYNGVWYDAKRHCIGTGRVSKWTLDLTSGRWTRQRWTYAGGQPQTFTIRQQFFYHAGKDALYGFPGRSDIDYYSFGKCAAAGADWQPLKSAPNWASVAVSSCRLSEDEILFLWHHAKAERWGIYNMAREAWMPGSGDAVGDGRTLKGASEMMPAMLVPTWGQRGQVVRRGTADGLRDAWWLFDVASCSNLPYDRDGGPPAVRSQWPGNKWLHVEEAGLCMVLDDAVAIDKPAIRVMRYRD